MVPGCDLKAAFLAGVVIGVGSDSDGTRAEKWPLVYPNTIELREQNDLSVIIDEFHSIDDNWSSNNVAVLYGQ